jgi:hypothetical protein
MVLIQSTVVRVKTNASTAKRLRIVKVPEVPENETGTGLIATSSAVNGKPVQVTGKNANVAEQ